MKAAPHKKPSEGNRCAFIPRTEIALIWLRLYEGLPSKAKSLTSNLQERNQNVSLPSNLQADEYCLYFIYYFAVLISSPCVAYRPVSPCMILLDWTCNPRPIIMIERLTVLWMRASLLWGHGKWILDGFIQNPKQNDLILVLFPYYVWDFYPYLRNVFIFHSCTLLITFQPVVSKFFSFLMVLF